MTLTEKITRLRTLKAAWEKDRAARKAALVKIFHALNLLNYPVYANNDWDGCPRYVVCTKDNDIRLLSAQDGADIDIGMTVEIEGALDRSAPANLSIYMVQGILKGVEKAVDSKLAMYEASEKISASVFELAESIGKE